MDKSICAGAFLHGSGTVSYTHLVRVPGSKSITNRALLLAMLADGSCTLTGALFSDDSRYLQQCIADLGLSLIHIYIVPQEFMSDNGILAVYDGGIIPAFIEHTGIDAENIAEVYGTIQRAFIRADDDGVLLVNYQIILCIEQGTHELIGRGEIVKAV